jgi:acetyl esterase/lipase
VEGGYLFRNVEYTRHHKKYDQGMGMKNRVKHGLVLFIWRLINKFEERRAKKAILPAGVIIKSDVPYHNDGSIRQVLDVYYPETVTGLMPVIIYIHGGGFVAGDKLYVREYCATLADKGYTVVNINYGLAPAYKNPVQIQDVLTAMAWVKENVHSFYGDSERVVLAGDSAGAYLAAFAACVSTNPHLAAKLNLYSPLSKNEIKGVLLFSGLFDIATAYTRKFVALKSDIELVLGTSIGDYADLDKYSVIKNMTDQFPPAFISSGEVDGLHPESLELVKALESRQIFHKALLFDKKEKLASHAFQHQLRLHTAQLNLESVAEFLKKLV